MIVPVGIFGVYRATSVDTEATLSPALPIAAEDLLKNYPGGTCLVTGCSSELCVDAAIGPVNTICLWKEEYACYQQFGQCEVQIDGECGWTMDEKLASCLNQSPEPSPSPFILGTPVPQPSPTLTTSAFAVPSLSPIPSPSPSPRPSPSPTGGFFMPPVSPSPTPVTVIQQNPLTVPPVLPSLSPSSVAQTFLPPVPTPTTTSPSVVNSSQFSFSLFGRIFTFNVPTYLLTLFTN